MKPQLMIGSLKYLDWQRVANPVDGAISLAEEMSDLTLII